MAKNRGAEAAAERAAKKYGLDVQIFKAMIRQESGFNKNARSPVGAQGIAQFMPATAKQYGVNLNDGLIADDLDGAARYLRDNLKRTNGNYEEALSIYNSGRPDGYKSIPETMNYVKTIMGKKDNETASNTTSSPTPSVAPKADKPEEPNVFDIINKYREATAPGDPDPTNLLGTEGRYDPNKSAQEIQALVRRLTKMQEPAQAPQATPSNRSPSSNPDNRRSGGGPLLELFWQGAGGINVKNGKVVPQGFVSGHKDHVHVASGPITTVRLGKLAQDMGLHVGENPKFGGVAPVHVKNSNHYSNRAIDVSGDPALMRKYARRVAKQYGL